MSDKKVIKRNPKIDVERRQADNDRSVEVSYMLVLMRKYPDKAKEAAKKLSPQIISS